eukprot:7360318-Prymnesium_polylepis.1
MTAEALLPLLSAPARAAIAAAAAVATTAATTAATPADASAPRIKPEQVLWADQKHSKCVLGCSSKHEYLIPEDEEGEYLHPDEGGTLPARQPTVVPKFAQEARKAFAVMMKEVDGEMRGFNIGGRGGYCPPLIRHSL